MSENNISNIPQIISITNNINTPVERTITLPGGKGNITIVENLNCDYTFRFYKENITFIIKYGDTLKIYSESSDEINYCISLMMSNKGLVVEAEDIESVKSNVATLKSLTISNGTIDPEFNSDVFSYNVTFPHNTSNTEITAEPTDSNAEVNGSGSIPVSDGTAINIIVTAEDKESTKTYTLNCTVEKSNIATLDMLSLSDATLTPEFRSDITSYTATFPALTESTTVTAEPTDSNAEVSGTGEQEISNNGQLNIIVTAEDTKTTKTYIVSCIIQDE